MATLDLINLRKEFAAPGGGTVAAVNDISLNVGDGEFVCILGPSGCGKSTALRMIGGFEDPTAGDVRIDNASVIDLPPNKRPTAMVFQKYTLWPHMKVYDNIAFGLRLRRLAASEIDKQVNDALQLVGLASYGERYPSQLSGGEQQRIALARALVLRPKILLLDEPFSSLDALLRVRLREELRAIQRRVKITAIFVTHDQEEALSLADRIAVMNKGKIEQVDKPSIIYAHPKTLFAADFIGAMNLLPGRLQDNKIHIGQSQLSAPQGLDGARDLMIALRPEDIAVVPSTGKATWQAQINQLSDLGHYRKAFATADGVGQLKLYLPKSIEVSEGERVALSPMRYLVYQGDQAPVEVKLAN